MAFLNETLTGIQSFGVTFAILGALLVSFKLEDLLKLKNHAKGVNYAVIAAVSYGADFVVIDMLVS